MTEVSIIGATLYGNRGAEAMMTTIVGRITERDPEAIINIFSYYPDDDVRIVKKQSVNIYSSTPLYLSTVLFPFSILMALLKKLRVGFFTKVFPKSLRALGRSDVLIDISGVSFMDGREKFLPFNILSILPAMLLGVPVVKFSQALGPFSNTLNLISAKLFLPKVKKIFARGELTFKYLKDFGISMDIIDRASDLVFLHKTSDAITVENEDYVADLVKSLEEKRNDRNRMIGFCPSSVIASKANKEGWNYPELVYRITRELLNRGNIVLLFPNATRKISKNKLRNNDLSVIVNVMEYFWAFDRFHDKLFYVSEDINTKSIKLLLKNCDIIIASRFHAMINSLSMGKPTFILGWGHKYFEVMDQFDLHDCVIDYKEKDLQSIINKINFIIEKADNVQANICTLLPKVKNMSYRQFDFIYDFLKI